MIEILNVGIFSRVFVLVLLLTAGVGLLLLAQGVRSGRSSHCGIAVGLMIPVFLLLVPLTLIPLASGLVGWIVGSHPAALWWLLAVPLGVLSILLMNDLCRCLVWIARTPMVEKPPDRFIPVQATPRSAVEEQVMETEEAAGGDMTGAVGGGETSQALPRAHVLSYLTAVKTPTRVRMAAGTGVLTIGLLELVPCVFGFLALAWSEWNRYQEFRRWAGPLTWGDLYDSFGDGVLILLVLAGICAATLALTLLTGPIRRGRRAACNAALVLLLPTVAGVLFGTAGVGLLGLYRGLYAGGEGSRLSCGTLGLGLLVPVGVLVLLLLKDLCSFLRWIALYPMDEKPPEAFLPERGEVK